MREKKVKETINGINDRNSLVLNLLLSFIFLVIVYFAGNFRNWNSPFATNSDSRFSPKPEKNPTSHYFWQLKPEEVTFWSTASYWICYSLHQLFIWCCIYYSQMKKTKYSTKLHGINIIMIIGNIIFHILHLIQTHIFYDGLAQNVPEASSQSSVIIILSFIIAMESSERGIFLGYPTNPVKKSNMSLIRKYHGYAFAWGAVYTFWYHPTESTWGHLFGFFHTSILMLQGSLIFTEAHLNKYWTIFIEFWVTIHSGIISYQTKNGMWGMFVFGFAMLFFLNQIFYHKIWNGKSKFLRIIPLFFYVFLTCFGYYFIFDKQGRRFTRIHEVIRIPMIEIILVYFIFVLMFFVSKIYSNSKKVKESSYLKRISYFIIGISNYILITLVGVWMHQHKIDMNFHLLILMVILNFTYIIISIISFYFIGMSLDVEKIKK